MLGLFYPFWHQALAQWEAEYLARDVERAESEGMPPLPIDDWRSEAQTQ